MKVQRSRVKDNALEDRAFLLLCIFFKFISLSFFISWLPSNCCVFFWGRGPALGSDWCLCLRVAGSTTWMQSCPLCSLASVQFCFLSAVVPCTVLCNVVFFSLLSHLQSCLSAISFVLHCCPMCSLACSKWFHVQCCHVFNIVLCAILTSVA